MGDSRVQVDGKSSSTLTPGFKPEKSSFLKQRYQDRVEVETTSPTAEKQLSTSGQSTPTPPPSAPPPLSHSFGRMSVLPIQAKLTIGQPNDKYEQEADRVAEQVMRMPESGSPAAAITRPVISPVVQRVCSECEEELQRQPLEEVEEEEEPIQTKPITVQMPPLVQRQTEEEEEEELLQAKPLVSQITPLVQRQVDLPEEKEEEETVQTKPIINHVLPLVQRQVEVGEEEKEEEELLQSKPLVSRISPLIQRMDEQTEEDEEKLQTKLLTRQFPPLVQRMGLPTEEEKEEEEEEEQTVRAKEQLGQTPHVTPTLDTRLNASRGSGQPLPQQTLNFMESRFGQDFSSVRVHTDAEAVQMNRELNAQAFTNRQDVFFGVGKYNPESSQGKRLLAHELTHVVQQVSTKAFDKSSVQRQELALAGNAREEDTGEAAQKALEGTTGRILRKPGRISREQFLRHEPDPGKGENVIDTLQFNNAVFVEAVGGKDDGWYKIVSETGKQGWVPKVSVALDPPEPTAELYKVQSGDKAIDLAGRWYGPPGGWKRWWWPGSDDAGDARFYVGALAFANKGREGMPSPDDLTKRDAWMKVQVIKGLTIWKPSKQFLRTLRGRVSSGSITKELWEDVKKVAKAIWEFAVFAAAFISGLLYGAGESIYDLFAGVVDLAKIAWSIAKSLLTGNIISDAKKFWEDLQKIDVSALAKDFQNKWFANDPWDAGFFQGRVLGYVIMEIIMLVASGGILTALKWTGKFAKIGALIAKLPRVAKAVEAVKGTEAAAKLGNLLSKSGKAVKGIETIVLEGGRIAAKGARWAANGVFEVGSKILHGTWSVVDTTVKGVKKKIYYFYDDTARVLKEIPTETATKYVHCSSCKLTSRGKRERRKGKRKQRTKAQGIEWSGNPRSPEYGHSVSQHGPSTATDAGMWSRATQYKIPKGRFLNESFIVDAEKATRGKATGWVRGTHYVQEIEIRNVGRVFLPDGKTKVLTHRVRVIREGANPYGRVVTSYPVLTETLKRRLRKKGIPINL